MLRIEGLYDGDDEIFIRIMDGNDFAELPGELEQKLEAYEEQFTSKVCKEYRKYDENHIPIDFDADKRLKDKDWWIRKLHEVRELLVQYLGKQQDYTGFDRDLKYWDVMYWFYLKDQDTKGKLKQMAAKYYGFGEQ